MTESQRDLIVIGASSGGVMTLRKLLAGLPPELPAAVLVVQHLATYARGALPSILAGDSALPVEAAEDGAPYRQGTVHVAVPDRHLLVEGGIMRLTRGPRENRARPAVDALFRSAAVSAGPRVIGVVLSGMLDDGAAGLASIKDCGGLAVVQDPADAAYPEMPEAAAAAADPDHMAPVAELPALLADLAGRPAGPPCDVPAYLLAEVDVARGETGGIVRSEHGGELSEFSCPECGGPMWQSRDRAVVRYRCHTGHAHTQRTLHVDLSRRTEESLWVALRTLEEQVRLQERLIAQSGERTAELLRERHEELKRHAGEVRRLLVGWRAGTPDTPTKLTAETPEPG